MHPFFYKKLNRAHQDIIGEINMPKRKTIISVKTLHGEQKDVIAVSGLFVKCVTNHSKLYPESNIAIELPCTYSRSFIAAEPEDIPTPTKIRSWKHLQALAEKIPEYDPKIPIGLRRKLPRRCGTITNDSK